MQIPGIKKSKNILPLASVTIALLLLSAQCCMELDDFVALSLWVYHFQASNRRHQIQIYFDTDWMSGVLALIELLCFEMDAYAQPSGPE